MMGIAPGRADSVDPNPDASSAVARSDEPVVVLTPMRRRHLRTVLRIETHTQPRGWSLGLFLGELARPEGRRYLVAKVGSQVVGFAGMLFIGTDGHVTTISVDPDWRRQGIATRLLAQLCREARIEGATALTLEVRATNVEAQALYRVFGFAPSGIRRNYYKEINEDAMVMWVHDVDTDAYAARLTRLEAGVRGTTRLQGIEGVETIETVETSDEIAEGTSDPSSGPRP
jgi:ribosomal-protein-alanine N-acetyltransferase